MAPSAISRSTRSLLMADHTLFGFLGANQSAHRSSSSFFGLESIQPKHSASSTASS